MFESTKRFLVFLPHSLQEHSYRRDNAQRLGHSQTRDKGWADGTAIATVASNTVKVFDPKTLQTSIHYDFDADAR